MKKLKKLLIVLCVLFCIVYYLLFGSPIVDWRNEKLVEATNNITTGTITLEELVPFAWDAVYVFEPYTSKEEVAETLGFRSVKINESWTESQNWYYFVKGNRIVANPEKSSLGCYIDLPNNREGRSCGSAHYGDYVLFDIVENANGYRYWEVAEIGTTEIFEYMDLKLQVTNIQSVRTDTFTSESDPSNQWACVSYVFYPGATVSVLDLDMLLNEDAEYSNWVLVDQGIRYAHNDDATDYWRRLSNDDWPIELAPQMKGVIHTESMQYVVKFEQYKE